MRKKAFITGIAGFAGSYLSELLLLKGWKVYGLLAPGEKSYNIDHIKDGINLERFNLLKGDRLTKSVKSIKPDYIFHLAAFSSVGQSFANEKLVYDINFIGTLNLIEASAGIKNIKNLLFISSSDIYGHFKPHGKTLDENQSFNPVSPYAISKAACEMMIQYHVKRNRMPISIARPFNHTGPRQTDAFVVPSFCRQVAEIESSGKNKIMKVGDLSARRDLSDVRDIVAGYHLAATKGKPGEAYQLCSGKSVAIDSVLNKIIGLSHADIKVNIDKSRFRKTDIPVLRGSNKKAVNQLGWNIRYKLETTLSDTLNYWREKNKL